jgi:hypothetical protein
VAFQERNLVFGRGGVRLDLDLVECGGQPRGDAGPRPRPENRYAFELRDRVDLCDKDFRSCLARVCGFTLKGSPILRPYEAGPFLVAADLSLPETLPAEAGTVRRKAA